MELIFLTWIASVLVAAAVATRKGSPISGTFLAICLGPIGLLIVLLSGSANRVACTFCAEKILKKATVCPHCQREVRVAKQ